MLVICYNAEEFLKGRYRLGVRTEDSQSSNPGSIPGSATKILSISAINYLTHRLPTTTICTVCPVLCSLQKFISFVDGHPDLLQAGMLVKPRHVHFAMAHDIHHGHHIARSVHRVGTESVPSTIEHSGLG